MRWCKVKRRKEKRKGEDICYCKGNKKKRDGRCFCHHPRELSRVSLDSPQAFTLLVSARNFLLQNPVVAMVGVEEMGPFISEGQQRMRSKSVPDHPNHAISSLQMDDK